MKLMKLIEIQLKKKEGNEVDNDENKLKHKCQLYISSLIIF
jgi:hypothetical protein